MAAERVEYPGRGWVEHLGESFLSAPPARVGRPGLLPAGWLPAFPGRCPSAACAACPALLLSPPLRLPTLSATLSTPKRPFLSLSLPLPPHKLPSNMPPAPVHALAWSPDGSLLAVAAGERATSDALAQRQALMPAARTAWPARSAPGDAYLTCWLAAPMAHPFWIPGGHCHPGPSQRRQQPGLQSMARRWLAGNDAMLRL
jgi:hypothetical protein